MQLEGDEYTQMSTLWYIYLLNLDEKLVFTNYTMPVSRTGFSRQLRKSALLHKVDKTYPSLSEITKIEYISKNL